MQGTISGRVENFEPHQLKTAAVLEHLQVDIARGLSTTEVRATQGKLRQDLIELDSDRKNAFIQWVVGRKGK
jgi:hypothetical protein